MHSLQAREAEKTAKQRRLAQNRRASMTDAFSWPHLAARGAIPASTEQRRATLSTIKTLGHYRAEREITVKNSHSRQMSVGHQFALCVFGVREVVESPVVKLGKQSKQDAERRRASWDQN